MAIALSWTDPFRFPAPTPTLTVKLLKPVSNVAGKLDRWREDQGRLLGSLRPGICPGAHFGEAVLLPYNLRKIIQGKFGVFRQRPVGRHGEIRDGERVAHDIV